MSFEKFNKEVPASDKEESEVIITGVDKEGNPVYEKMEQKLPEVSHGVPKEVMHAIIENFNNLPENNNPLKFKVNDILALSINSDNTARYVVFDARKGHYLIMKIEYNPSATEGTVLLAEEDKATEENPDLIVCTESELENWLKPTKNI